MIDYLLSLQVFAAVYVIVGIGYGCSGIKLFNSSNAEAIRKILNYVCIPGLVFHQIGVQQFSYEIFKPFLIGLLVQCALQILILVISFVFPFESKTHKYVSLFYSLSYYDCLFACIPITQFIYGEKYNYIPVMLAMVQFLIVIPVHNLLAFRILGPPTTEIDESSDNNNGEMKLEDQESHSIDEIPTKRITVNGDNPEAKTRKKTDIKRRLSNSSEKLENSANHTSFLEIEKGKKENESTEENDKFIDSNEKQKETENKNNDDDDNISNNNDDDTLDKEGKEGCIKKNCSCFNRFFDKFRVKNVWTSLFFSLFTPINICFLLGIIWSLVGLKMPKFLAQFVTDLGKTVVAGGLFACGIFMWNHPFFGCSPIEIPILVIVHIVLIPLLGFLFCWILKVENDVAQIIMFCLAAPSSLSSFYAAIYNHLPNSTITYTFFWTYLLCLPVFMLWTVVFNQTKIFNL